MDPSSDIVPGAEVPVLDRPWIEVLDAPLRVTRTLEGLGTVTLRDVVLLSDQKLMAAPNFGVASLRQLRSAAEEAIEKDRARVRRLADAPQPGAAGGGLAVAGPAVAGLAALRAEARSLILPEDRRIFDLHWSGRRTLDAIGAGFAVTKERGRPKGGPPRRGRDSRGGASAVPRPGPRRGASREP